LVVDDLVRQEALLAMPLTPQCREDCRGLCPQCGQDLNAESCACGPRRRSQTVRLARVFTAAL